MDGVTVGAEEAVEELHRMVGQLRAQLQQGVEARFLDELSIAETAGELGLTDSAVTTHRSRSMPTRLIAAVIELIGFRCE